MKDMSLHLSKFVRGEIYLANNIVSTLGELPELPIILKARPNSLDAMKYKATKHLVFENEESLEVVSKGRAYLNSKLSLIMKEPWKDLYPSYSAVQPEQPGLGHNQQVLESLSDGDKKSIGGAFLNVGHYLDGVAIKPGSGKAIAELVLGKKHSVDTSNFDLPASAGRKPH